MKHRLLYTLVLIVLSMVAVATDPAEAQRKSNEPYYAIPSWDQQLPASTRFLVMSDWASAAVLDLETGLVWEKLPGTHPFQYFDAQYYCNNLTLGNRKGWRVPTIQELASLVDPSVPYPGPTLPAGHPFILRCTQQPKYWSATTYGYSPTGAWTVDFDTGIVDSVGYLYSTYVWCVRGGQGVNIQ